MLWGDEVCFKVEICYDIVYKSDKMVNLVLSKYFQFWKDFCVCVCVCMCLQYKIYLIKEKL